MDFSWLDPVRGSFVWYFSTRTECHQAKANIQWNDGCKKLCDRYGFYSVVVLTGSIYCIQLFTMLLTVIQIFYKQNSFELRKPNILSS